MIEYKCKSINIKLRVIWLFEKSKKYRKEVTMEYGKKVWIFPDAELPPRGENEIPGHESIIITNTGERDAHIHITLPSYFYTWYIGVLNAQ